MDGYREVSHPRERFPSGVFNDARRLQLRGKGWPEMLSGRISEAAYLAWLQTLRSTGVEATELQIE